MAEATKTNETVSNEKGVENLDKEINDFMQTLPKTQAAPAKSAPKKARIQKKKAPVRKISVMKGKRKEAVARASVVHGEGTVSLNGMDVNLLRPLEFKEIIMEPIRISKDAEDIFKESRIRINVYGGGAMGQVQAARNALAKAIVDAAGTKGEKIKTLYMDYDRNMLVDDTRRVEPKKFKGPKARARFQTSYR
jgi:small subunit ribosomal protein S9